MPSASESTAAIHRERAPLESGQARLLLRALADPIRLQVIQALAAGERCVCDLTADLGLAQSKLSFHLRVLREAGLVADRQSGRWVYYRLRPEAIAALGAWLRTLTTACDQPHQGCA
jgi:ArsR family transcriptional regulator